MATIFEKTLVDQPVVALADHARRHPQLLGNLCEGDPPILAESVNDLQIDIVQTPWNAVADLFFHKSIL